MKKGLVFGSILALLIIVTIVIIVVTNKHCDDGNTPSGTPGLRRYPIQPEDKKCSSVIQYNADNEDDVTGWVTRYQKFLDDYEKLGNGVNCAHGNGATKDKVCKFDLSRLGECRKGKFGYNTGNPCIILELNKIEDLKYSAVDINNLPKNHGMSDELVAHVKTQQDKDQVWVECQGESKADKDALDGKEIKYYPRSQGFPTYYFPYLKENKDKYKSPLVAVQFKGVAGKKINIQCRAFANAGKYELGVTRFQLDMTKN